MASRSSPHSTRRRSSYLRRRALTGQLYTLPAAVLVAVFFLVPLGLTVWLSMHHWPLLGSERWAGIENYVELAGDATFRSSIGFTALYTALVTPPHLILGYFFAVLVRRRLRSVAFFRTAYFLPVVVGFATTAYVFIVLLHPSSGITATLGIADNLVNWQADPALSLLIIVAIVSWKTMGTAMILFMAGMQAVPGELLEAAQVDGAGWWRREALIVLPLLRRTTALVLVLTIAVSFLAFEQFYLTTHGGPDNATLTTVMWLYTTSFVHYRLGYGATMSIVLLFILVALSVIQIRLLRDRTEEGP